MELREKGVRALELCGYLAPTGADDFRFLGEGAWHHAFLVTLRDGQTLDPETIIRMGDKEAIAERLPLYLRQLETLGIE